MRARLRLNQGLIGEAERLVPIQRDEMVGVSPIHPRRLCSPQPSLGRIQERFSGPSAPINLGGPAEPQDAYAPPTESQQICRHVSRSTSFCKVS